MFYFFLKQKLAYHKLAFGSFCDGFVIDSFFYFLKSLGISDITMEVSLCWASFIGLQSFQDAKEGLYSDRT